MIWYSIFKTYRIDLIKANADAGRDERMNEIESLIKRIDKSNNSEILNDDQR
jgi:hypothetical protein